MNKKELIDKYKSRYAEEPKDWKHSSVNASRQALYTNFINDLEKLDEPKKVVVPKFVAEWIKLYKKENKTTLWYAMNKIVNEKFLNHKNVVIWFEYDNNKIIFEQAWVNGYEVEKEPLYYVKIPVTTWNDDSSELEIEHAYLILDVTSEETRLSHSN